MKLAFLFGKSANPLLWTACFSCSMGSLLFKVGIWPSNYSMSGKKWKFKFWTNHQLSPIEGFLLFCNREKTCSLDSIGIIFSFFSIYSNEMMRKILLSVIDLYKCNLLFCALEGAVRSHRYPSS
jgi:hypothetical protein